MEKSLGHRVMDQYENSTVSDPSAAGRPVIRHGTEADLPAIMRLIRQKAEFDGCPDALEATPDALRRAWFSEHPRGYVLIAVLDGRAVGIATYFPTFSTFLARPGLWLDDLYVVEECRSLGIGRDMLAALARIARERGCGRVEWTVALDNDRGIAFYERHGAAVRHLSRCVRLNREGIERLSEAEAAR
jgi:GNAT superfamily N-acetyltransferase